MQHGLRLVLDRVRDGAYIVDRGRRVLYWNAAAERISGFSRDEVIGKCCADNILIHVDECGTPLCTGGCPLTATIQNGALCEANLYLHHKSGHRVPVAIRTMPFQDPESGEVGAIELFAQVQSDQEIQARMAELSRLALLDDLTGIPNRRHLQGELAARMARFNDCGIPFGVLLIDVDHFKEFNDVHGHAVGDLTLQTVARTIRAATRTFDVAGRWGGEEFLGIFPGVIADGLAGIANRLLMMVRTSRVKTGTTSLGATASAGGTIALAGDTVVTILDRVDGLLYRSKRDGRDRVSLG